MVVVEITRWPTPTRGPLGRVLEVLGDIDEPGVDTEIIIRKFGIPDEHSRGRGRGSDAARRRGRASGTSTAGPTSGRSATVTIDGEHARDFDDAITIERLPNGHYWLGVHIADVAHYVPEGGALDEEAYERGTSVYFPDRAVHMFPSELVDRALQPESARRSPRAVVRDGHRPPGDGRAVRDARRRDSQRRPHDLHRRQRDPDASSDPDVTARYSDFVPMFETMRELFEILNERRRRRGSIDFDLKEPEIVLDDQGMVEEIIAAERNIAHRIIEEFMLVANETVAQHLDEHDMPTLYRIHESRIRSRSSSSRSSSRRSATASTRRPTT